MNVHIPVITVNTPNNVKNTFLLLLLAKCKINYLNSNISNIVVYFYDEKKGIR